MTNTELFNLISKPWASVTDIMKIALCGRDSATLIRNYIKSKVIQEGYHLPTSKEILVPMKYVIDYLKLDIDYITTMAKNEQSINSEKGGK